MNFSVHFDDATVASLTEAVRRTGATRNRLIVRAVQEWLERNAEKDWPAALRAHWRNPAPDEETLELEAWREHLPRAPETRW